MNDHDKPTAPPREPAQATDGNPPGLPRTGSSEQQPEMPDQPKPEKTRWHRRPFLVAPVMLAIIVLALAGTLWWLHWRHIETTDDAYIDIQPQYVSPQVAGRVLHVRVTDNQDVTAGQPLLEIDPADYQSRLDQALATMAQAQAQQQQAQAQLAVADAQFQQYQASVVVAEANATNALRDLDRYQDLRKAISGAVSQQQMDTAVTAARSASAQLLVAQRAAAAAEAQLGYARSQIQAAKAARQSADAQVQEARLNLSYTTVKSSLNGRIANKTVAEGNYIQPGTALMAVVPTNVYVTANFKETQLAHMRAGQAARIHIDAYPDLELGGHVDSVQPGAGQVFSVLPAQNATGNWVKIVQRVPVKIMFDEFPNDPARRLAPGMSVEVKVTVR